MVKVLSRWIQGCALTCVLVLVLAGSTCTGFSGGSGHSVLIPTATAQRLQPTVHEQVAFGQRLPDRTFGVTCPAGEVALSGGWRVEGHGPSSALPVDAPYVSASQRLGTDGWHVYVEPINVAVRVWVYAECLKNAPNPVITEYSASSLVGGRPAQSGPVSVETGCAKSDEVLVGGAFTIVGGDPSRPTSVELYNFAPRLAADGSAVWHGSAWIHLPESNTFSWRGNTLGSVQVTAECLSVSPSGAQSSSTPFAQVSLLDTQNGAALSHPCPSGSWVSGGGYVYGRDAWLLSMHRADSSEAQWEVMLFAIGYPGAGVFPGPLNPEVGKTSVSKPKPELLNAYAICLTFPSQ